MDIIDATEPQIPTDLDRYEAHPSVFEPKPSGQLDSLSIVLSQEMDKFNRLLAAMRTSLRGLRKAIKGEVVMSLDLDKMYSSFMNNAVPELWSKVSFASLKSLGSWIDDMKLRLTFMHLWLESGKPKVFPFDCFFFPQGFMTGALQNHARKYAIAVDTLSFEFEVQTIENPQDIPEGPDDGVICYNLYLEQARWDREKRALGEAMKGEMVSLLPPIHFLPNVKRQVSPLDPPVEGVCSVPCYKTSVRQGVLSTTGISTNFVISINLKTLIPAEKWILKGTAILLNLDL